MEKLIVFGCSFTFGENLDDLPEWYNDETDPRNYMPLKLKYNTPSKKSYPFVIGSLLNCEVENYGWRGGSNDRIFRTFFDHVISNKESSIYIIQWTFPHRTEFWSNDSNSYVGIVPSFVDINQDDEAINFAKKYYKKYYSSDDVKDKLVRYIWSVDTICNQFNHRIYQFFPIKGFDLDMKLPTSFLQTNKILDLVKEKIHPDERGHIELANYLRKLI